MKITRRFLSEAYKIMGVKKRKLRKWIPTNNTETPERLAELEQLKMSVEDILRRGDLILFVDESTFSPKSYLTEVWQMPGQEIKTTPRF